MKEKMINYKHNAFNKEQEEELDELYFINQEEYPIDITGNACKNDDVCFVKAKFIGSYPKASFGGFEIVRGKIIKDNYGKEKQQHTFTIMKKNRELLRIKGRNLYKYFTLSKYRDVNERKLDLENKYSRGKLAKKAKEMRSREEQEEQEDNNYMNL